MKDKSYRVEFANELLNLLFESAGALQAEGRAGTCEAGDEAIVVYYTADR